MSECLNVWKSQCLNVWKSQCLNVSMSQEQKCKALLRASMRRDEHKDCILHMACSEQRKTRSAASGVRQAAKKNSAASGERLAAAERGNASNALAIGQMQ